MAPREPFPGSIQYTVKSGDSLYRIAQRSGISICGLKLINGLTSNMIYEGLALNLPGETSAVFARHVVKAGETLCSMSLGYNALVGDVMRESGLMSDAVAAGQVLTVPLVRQRPLQEVLVERVACCRTARPCMIVDKSQHTLMLFTGGIWLKTYHVELGRGGQGDWELPGDGKTPEGTYHICQTSGAVPRERPPDPSGSSPGSDVCSRDRSASPGESRCAGRGVAPQTAESPLVNVGNPACPPSRHPGSVWLDLRYPNIKDAYRGLQRGLIDWDTYDSIAASINNDEMPPQDTPLGGGIGILGGGRPDLGSDWTGGSIALTDNGMGEVHEFVSRAAICDAQVQCCIIGAGQP